MSSTRAFILAVTVALAVQAGIYYLLDGLGASSFLILKVEMIWLCLSIVLCLWFLEHFEGHDTDR